MKSAGSFVLCLLLIGCGSSGGEQAGAGEPSGKQLYEAKCALCHGRNGVARNMARGAANLNDPDWQARTSLEEIVQVVTEGRGRMPAWGDRLSEEEIRAVAEHVRSLD